MLRRQFPLYAGGARSPAYAAMSSVISGTATQTDFALPSDVRVGDWLMITAVDLTVGGYSLSALSPGEPRAWRSRGLQIGSDYFATFWRRAEFNDLGATFRLTATDANTRIIVEVYRDVAGIMAETMASSTGATAALATLAKRSQCVGIREHFFDAAAATIAAPATQLPNARGALSGSALDFKAADTLSLPTYPDGAGATWTGFEGGSAQWGQRFQLLQAPCLISDYLQEADTGGNTINFSVGGSSGLPARPGDTFLTIVNYPYGSTGVKRPGGVIDLPELFSFLPGSLGPWRVRMTALTEADIETSGGVFVFTGGSGSLKAGVGMLLTEDITAVAAKSTRAYGSTSPSDGVMTIPSYTPHPDQKGALIFVYWLTNLGAPATPSGWEHLLSHGISPGTGGGAAFTVFGKFGRAAHDGSAVNIGGFKVVTDYTEDDPPEPIFGYGTAGATILEFT